MKIRTFQEIYDFCHTDDTYRMYFQAPDELHVTDSKTRKYYYGNLRSGQCRLGTFIYCQSMRQLERFVDGAKQDYYIHLDALTCKEVGLKDEMPLHSTVYIVVHVREHGVQFGIEHPLHDGRLYLTARSHRPFTKEGVMAEARAYIDKHILLPPGRYRDLQMEYMIAREQFPAWYKQYKNDLHEQAECEHWNMVDKYRHANDITYAEGYGILAASGMFFDFNCDEFERGEMTEQFVRLCNET